MDQRAVEIDFSFPGSIIVGGCNVIPLIRRQIGVGGIEGYPTRIVEAEADFIIIGGQVVIDRIGGCALVDNDLPAAERRRSYPGTD